MRVLIGYDGSKGAETALDLVRALSWPTGTQLRVVQVAQPVGDTSFAGAVASMPAGVVFDTRVLHDGNVGSVLVAAGHDFKADLIITGHRGHGAMTSVFLGSVARDVVEHADRPVLIARRPTCDRIVFAEDGSESAYAARRLLTTSAIFQAKPVHVVAVAQLQRPLLAAAAAVVSEGARASATDAASDARVSYQRLAHEVAEELRIAGLNPTADVREGDPAEQILAAAREVDADLIVMGTRGRGGVARVLLGSVARAVLLGARCSVLVVPASHLG